ncbi:MAG: hypothetical protein KCHDKBKB_00119 [Elusimicrobia bacterium]|nr:hypothetical protein [Elusimicrobiota bacterium]
MKLTAHLILFSCLISFSGLVSPPLQSAEPARAAEPDLPSVVLAPPRQFTTVTDPKNFKIVSDAGTKIQSMIFQCPNPQDPFLSQMLRVLRPNIMVIIMVTDSQTATSLWRYLNQEKLTDLRERVRFVIADPPRVLTRWGRDPYLVLYNEKSDMYALVEGIQPQSPRYNGHIDRAAVVTLLNSDIGMKNLSKGNFQLLSTMNVEGGAITSDDTFVYMGGATINGSMGWNAGTPTFSQSAVANSFTEIMGKKIAVMPNRRNHNDRYHMPVGKTRYGERTSLLSDPVKALQIIASLSPGEKKIAMDQILATRSRWLDQNVVISSDGKRTVTGSKPKITLAQLKEFFDVTDQKIERLSRSMEVKLLDESEIFLENQGIHVVRVPNLQAEYVIDREKGQSYEDAPKLVFPLSLPYVNIIQDSTRTDDIVFIPRFNIPKLDDHVKAIFSDLDKYTEIHQILSVDEAIDRAGPRCRVQTIGKPVKPLTIAKLGKNMFKKMRKSAKTVKSRPV